MEAKQKHLEFIQGVISRMAKNSFLLKGWCLTVIGGAVTFSMTEDKPVYLALLTPIILIFWLLDAYYLHKEKEFRDLYDLVRAKEEWAIDFNMHLGQVPDRGTMLDCVLTWTLMVFYGGVLALVWGLYFY